MSESLGKINKVKLESKGHNRWCKIEFTTINNVNIDDMVKIIFCDKPRYFQVRNITTSLNQKILSIIAEEMGYYNIIGNIKELDIRKVTGIEVFLANEEEKEKIRIESRLL